MGQTEIHNESNDSSDKYIPIRQDNGMTNLELEEDELDRNNQTSSPNSRPISNCHDYYENEKPEEFRNIKWKHSFMLTNIINACLIRHSAN